ncbi:patj homolog [Phlebotomus argentipes]|uniref:patj homolog n=1 Tax=Phlebotomus argentipes TaxID=94469 RepID=UPI002892E385|nr:patj homolog [Phlebotomus argentipes]
MHLNADISSALQQIEAIKKVIDESDDPKLQQATNDDLKLILDILTDPVFRNIVQVQDSLAELNTQIAKHPSILAGDFDITASGDLVLTVPATPELYAEYPDEQRVPSAQLSPRDSVSPSTVAHNFNSLSGPIGSVSDQILSMESHQFSSLTKKDESRGVSDEERPQSAVSEASAKHADVIPSEWAQIQAIELINDGTGLGFGIIGARTAGVIVKTILAGGVADRDQRLRSGDHILQIGDVNLHDMVSEQVASVLRQSGTHVRLVVARPVDPMTATQDVEGTAIVPSRLLTDPAELERYLIAAGYPEIFGDTSTPSTPTSSSQAEQRFKYSGDISMRPRLSPPLGELELPETERFTVELTKDSNGLGITIAGYVCEKEELSGIFVKSVSPGSAADVSGRIQVNDRIIEVDGQSLQGFSNHEAVDVLKKSGAVVCLCLERYLRGPKYEQLQQAIAANELKPSTPATPPHVQYPGRPLSASSHYRDDERKHSIGSVPDLLEKKHSMDGGRKLALARDSLETKAELPQDVEDELGEDEEELIVQPRKMSIIETANIATINKHKYFVEPILTEDIEAAIRKKWHAIVGNDVIIVVAQIRKFTPVSGLGISLEGTVDVEGGREVRPHHYIRSILPEGPVGQNGLLQSADELLEVNGQRLLGMNHLEVVSILKELPQDVRMVCARDRNQMVPFTEENICNALGLGFQSSPNLENLTPASERLVKAKSDGSLATSASSQTDENFVKMKSRSLEPLTGLAMWSSEPQIIELVKGERGLGFSILDYQDPLDSNDTLIVIRSLVPGGVAQLDGRLIPGDRLLFVNDINLENASLDQAVQALKGAAKGVVRIGVAKPLPMTDTSAIQLGERPVDLSGRQDAKAEWHHK